jgi:hypothetical protein
VRLLSVLLALLALAAASASRAEEPPSPRPSREADALARAKRHYDAGVGLFESGNKEQALVEFQIANDLAPEPESVFMIAQCEYHLGRLVEARAHYQAFLAEHGKGELADLARLRIDAINRRPGVLVINTVPDAVDIRIEGGGQVATGQAPNQFRVPPGAYRVLASKPNYATEILEVSLDVAETKPLFFKLEPIPAHLTIRTNPPNAALFVRGNRAQNPYVQDVPPGSYEIYAEASYYQPKRETVTLAPGENRVVEFPLTYVQRSGRPELIGFWTGMGAIGGGLAMLTQTNPKDSAAALSISLLGAGVLAGGMGLGVLSSTTPLVPSYIRDNLALFRIGAMWIGDVEGAALAMGLSGNWSAAWLGGAAGLTAGAFAGWWLDDKAPNYGRVALIQSAALLGAAGGMVAMPGLGLYPQFRQENPQLSPDAPAQQAYYRDEARRRLAWGMLAGLNVGLAAGLAMAYLPEQSKYGPSWQRVLMVDLAGLAGAIFATTIEICSRRGEANCANNTETTLDERTARFALVGASVGILTGWLLTMDFDRDLNQRPELPVLSWMPLPGALPTQSTAGTADLVPGLVSQGRF